MALAPLDPTYPTAGPVTLKPLTELSNREWGRFHAYFRDREIAEWNGSGPLRMPLWLFRRVVLGEEKSGERRGFGIFTEADVFIGSVELYDITPSRPRQPVEATLGIVIGERAYWSRGYGTHACQAVLEYAFLGLGLKQVKLITVEHNRRARRAFEKAGFSLDRVAVGGRGLRDAHYRVEREGWLEGRSS